MKARRSRRPKPPSRSDPRRPLYTLNGDTMTRRNMITRTVFPAAVVALVALALPAFVRVRADDKPAAAAVAVPPSRLAEDLTGVWVLVGRPGAVREAPEAGGRLKFRTGRHWVMTQADPKTGVVVMHDGGTYTLEGDRYSETLEYANP